MLTRILHTDLRATFTGSQGAEVINFQKYYLYNMEGSGNQLASVLNRWHSDENPGSGGVFRAARSSTPNTSQRLSSYMVDDPISVVQISHWGIIFR